MSETDRLFVRLGPRKYRVERPWGRPPKDVRFSPISGVTVDSKDNVYVLIRRDAAADPKPGPAVLVFSPEGDFVRAFGEQSVADSHGAFVGPGDRILIGDRDGHQIFCFDSEGRVLFTLGTRHEPLSPFNHPTDAAVGPNGDIYVSDGYANSCVHRFSKDGKWKQTWGRPGQGPGEFALPHAIWVLADGRVLVADRRNCRIQVFTADGAYLTEWRDVFNPADIYVDRDGLIHVCDDVPRVTVLTPDGIVVGRGRPTLNSAHGMYGDSKRNLYLAETNPARITKLALVN